MRLFWILVVAAAVFFAHRYYTETVRPGRLERAPSAAAVGGGPAREWQQAPNALMGMQDAIGGGSSNPSGAMVDTVRRGAEPAGR